MGWQSRLKRARRYVAKAMEAVRSDKVARGPNDTPKAHPKDALARAFAERSKNGGR